MSDAIRQPSLYIPHGGGPCFFMDWNPPDAWLEMGTYLSGLSESLPVQPDALIVISAHWEADPIAITAAAQPELIYDYYGFPDHTYELSWPAAGAPALAVTALELLNGAGIKARLDNERGFDHGVFIPLKLMFPDAQIPTIQISLHPSLDPALHLATGKALGALRSNNGLIIGSGMSFHNIGGLMGRNPAEGSAAFDEWLNKAVMENQSARDHLLNEWSQAPAARHCHPREEHLLPLHVVAGAAGEDPCTKDYSGNVLGASVSAFRFG